MIIQQSYNISVQLAAQTHRDIELYVTLLLQVIHSHLLRPTKGGVTPKDATQQNSFVESRLSV